MIRCCRSMVTDRVRAVLGGTHKLKDNFVCALFIRPLVSVVRARHRLLRVEFLMRVRMDCLAKRRRRMSCLLSDSWLA